MFPHQQRCMTSRHCPCIPSEIKDEYFKLKKLKGVSRGRKKYWATSATRKGLRNGKRGIVFSK